MKFHSLVFVLVLLFQGNAQTVLPCTEIPALNQQVLDVVRPTIGKKIDRGECWDLVKFALNQVHAKWDGYQQFGVEINRSKECIQPGDVLQFDQVELAGTDENGFEFTESFYHHYAIVYAVTDSQHIQLIHQNTGQYGKKVGVTSMNFSTLKKGTIRVFRPVSD